MWDWLRAIWAALARKKRIAVRFAWSYGIWVGGEPPAVLRKLEDSMLVPMTNTQKLTLRVQPLDAYQHASRVDGIPQWTQSDASIGTLTPAADGMSAVFSALGPLGLTQVAVQADADLGPGVRMIGTPEPADIQVEAGEAVSLRLLAEAPEPQ
jgi:hypothetical protein